MHPRKYSGLPLKNNSFFGELSRNMKQNAQYQLASLFDLPVAKQAKTKQRMSWKKFNDPEKTVIYTV